MHIYTPATKWEHSSLLVRFTSVLVFSLFLSSCSASSNNPCDNRNPLVEIPEFSKSIIIFGETHGNNESPRVFLDAICKELKQGNKEVEIGLEVPIDLQKNLDQFLKSDGSDLAINQFLSHSFWSKRFESDESTLIKIPPNHDGRSSKAMFEMIDTLREMNVNYPQLIVFAFDEESNGSNGFSRDKNMAVNIMGFSSTNDTNITYILVGNSHATRFPIHDMPPLNPMGGLLGVETEIVSLLALGGESWNNYKYTLREVKDVEHTIMMIKKIEQYDYVLPIGRVTSSEPMVNK